VKNIPQTRKIIAHRLSLELQRRGATNSDLSSASGLPLATIQGYLSAQREISLSELQKISQSLYVNVFRLISKRYFSTNLYFRNVSREAIKFAANVEDAFLIIKDFLPVPSIPSISKIEYNFTDREALIGNVIPIIRKLKGLFENTEKMIDGIGLPIFPISSSANFDAFLLGCPPHYAICINLAKAPNRIIFSLLHEIAHFLFDRERIIDIDVLSTNLYADKFDDNTKPEFIAYKFAQFYLLPFERIDSLCLRWPDIDYSLAQELINVNRTSTEVLINAVYDLTQIRRKRFTYKSIKEELSNITSCYDNTIISYLHNKKEELTVILDNNNSHFSENVFKQVKRVLGL